jgi:hypothetical protein
MNLFVFVCGWNIHPKKKIMETLHHVLRAMMQFPVIFFRMDTPSTNKKINSFLKERKSCYHWIVYMEGFSLKYGNHFSIRDMLEKRFSCGSIWENISTFAQKYACCSARSRSLTWISGDIQSVPDRMFGHFKN